MTMANLLYARYVASAVGEALEWKAMKAACELDSIDEIMDMLDESRRILRFLSVILTKRLEAAGHSNKSLAGVISRDASSRWFIKDEILWYGAGEYYYQWSHHIDEEETHEAGGYLVAHHDGEVLILLSENKCKEIPQLKKRVAL